MPEADQEQHTTEKLAEAMDTAQFPFWKSLAELIDDNPYFTMEGDLPHVTSKEELEDLLTEDQVSLFEAALLLGFLVGNYPSLDPTGFAADSVKLFFPAFINGEIDPRDPHTLVRHSQLPKPCIRQAMPACWKPVDLNWMLTRRELYDWAATRWPADRLLRLIEDEPPERKPPRRTRRTRITTAVEAAVEALSKKLNRRPTSGEVADWLLDDNDQTGNIVDINLDAVVWIDTKGKTHDSSRKSLENIAGKILRTR